MNLTDQQRAELKALADAATPGPWYLRINRHPNTDGTKWGWLDTNDAGDQRPPEGVSVTWSQGRRSEANADFIIACRKYIPAILADLEEAERKFDECVGGFKRDLQQKLDDQRAQNERLKKCLAATKEQLDRANNRAELISQNLLFERELHEETMVQLAEAQADLDESKALCAMTASANAEWVAASDKLKNECASLQALLIRFGPLLMNMGYVGAKTEIARELQSIRAGISRSDALKTIDDLCIECATLRERQSKFRRVE